MLEEVLAHDEEDLYPQSKDEHDKLLARVNDMFTSADEARAPHYDRWKRYYRLYRSFQKKRTAGDYRSRVFIPVVFTTIETVLPRVTAALPGMIADPIGAEDELGAKNMEDLLNWCATRSELELQLVVSNHDALTYGTGILKTMHVVQKGVRVDRTQQMQPMEVPTELPLSLGGQQLTDMDGAEMLEHQMQPVTDGMGQPVQVPVMDEAGAPVMTTSKESYDLYNGPAAQSVDIGNFWVAPEATSIDDARFVIHRVIRDSEYVKKKIEEGIFTDPDYVPEGSFTTTDDPAQDRLSEIEMAAGRIDDLTRKAVEIWEVWVGDTVITVANRSRIMRVAKNPFAHGSYPFIRIVDHLVPHEFWGIGEVEVLEGIQDAINAMTNQRIDNVRLLLNAMFLVDTDAVEHLSDLKMRPGGVVRVKSRDGRTLDELVKRLDLQDVTGSAYSDVAELERWSEKVSAVSAYQTGTDASEQQTNDTATGVAIISEQANARFSHKIRMAELTGYRRLVQHFGVILQQFMPDELVLRIKGEGGLNEFNRLTPTDIQGSFDYDVEPQSTTQTESMRKQQSMSLFQLLANDPYMNPLKIREDLIESFGIKTVDEWMKPIEQIVGEFIQQQAQEMGLPPGGPMAPMTAEGAPVETAVA